MAEEGTEAKMHRLVHLDLKGAPHKLAYYEQLFPSLRNWGSTGVLVEYEDTFPYRDHLQELASPDAYSLEDVHRLQHIAASAGLMVVPLVQTFGHMEFVLKHKRLRRLRESRNYPNSICPSRDGSLALVQAMLSQVMELHPDVQWIHVGGDEVWQLGQCEECLRRMADEGWTVERLYLEHVKRVAEHIRQIRPGVGVIAWDDMFRRTDVRIILGKPPKKSIGGCIAESGIQNAVEPMIWNYNARDINIPPDIWDRYSLAFSHLWIASAFKGATGVSRALPDVAHHIANHESWLEVLRAAPRRPRLMLRGWALTGWQRYDHFSVLCDLLPASIPSLVLCLQTIGEGGFSQDVLLSSSALLGSPKPLDVSELSRAQEITQLQFPGSEVFVQIQTFVKLEAGYDTLIKSDGFRGWFSEFHAKYRFGNPLHVRPILGAVTSILNCFRQLRNEMETSFGKIYTPKTTEEWFAENLDPKMDHLADASQKLNDILMEQEVTD